MASPQDLPDFSKTQFRALEPHDLLKRSVSPLLGVGDAAAVSPGTPSVHSVLDPATSDAFDQAEKLSSAGPTSPTALAKFSKGQASKRGTFTLPVPKTAPEGFPWTR